MLARLECANYILSRPNKTAAGHTLPLLLVPDEARAGLVGFRNIGRSFGVKPESETIRVNSVNQNFKS